jgi:Fe-S cluster biosynthesis and repair protein YggX
MTEKERIQGEIKVLQSKLALLEEMENFKSPVEEAFKRIYGYYPGVCERSVWIAFQKGYEAAQKDYKVGEYQSTPQERGERIHKEVEKLQEKNWYVDAKDLIESGTALPEPTSTVFRQKLFDGIKSVFYDPEYERTHWKMKVDMAVDEVLTHFYDILPEPEEYIGDYGPSQGYVDGWNHYHEIIKEKLE